MKRCRRRKWQNLLGLSYLAILLGKARSAGDQIITSTKALSPDHKCSGDFLIFFYFGGYLQVGQSEKEKRMGEFITTLGLVVKKIMYLWYR